MLAFFVQSCAFKFNHHVHSSSWQSENCNFMNVSVEIWHFIIYIYIIQVTITSIHIKLNWKLYFNGICLLYFCVYQRNQWIWGEQHNKSNGMAVVKMFFFLLILSFCWWQARWFVIGTYLWKLCSFGRRRKIENCWHRNGTQARWFFYSL